MADRSSETLGREALLELFCAEIFKDGVAEEWERDLLRKLAGFLRFSSAEVQSAVDRAKARFRAGRLGTERPLDQRRLYARALELAIADGAVDDLEEDLLKGLRQLLGIDQAGHQEILRWLRRRQRSERDSEDSAAPPVNSSPPEDPAPPGDPLPPEDFDELRGAAEAGARRAQYELSLRLLYGRGCTKDVEEARRWLKRASDQGYRDAQYDRAVMIWSMDQDLLDPVAGNLRDEANRLFEELVAAGHLEATVTVATMFMTNNWRRWDRAEGERLLRIAAAGGHAPGQRILGKYLFGDELASDPLELMSLPEKGDPAGSDRHREGLEWIRAAAAQKDPEAMFLVGCLMYQRGRPSAEAVALFEEAETLGSIGAKVFLKSMRRSDFEEFPLPRTQEEKDRGFQESLAREVARRREARPKMGLSDWIQLLFTLWFFYELLRKTVLRAP